MKQKFNKHLKLMGFAAIGLASVAGTAVAGTIVGSPHDLTDMGKTWTNLQGEICIVCHTPHNAKEGISPLWNHTVTTGAHVMYDSTTFDGKATQSTTGPTGASKLCLSCHDGSVALDAFGQGLGTTFIGGTFNFGTDLTNDHPISFVYDDALALADGALATPSSTNVTVGEGADSLTGTLAETMIPTGELQCNSCHDVHNKRTVGGTKLLRISNLGSGLCLTCHTK